MQWNHLSLSETMQITKILKKKKLWRAIFSYVLKEHYTQRRIRTHHCTQQTMFSQVGTVFGYTQLVSTNSSQQKSTIHSIVYWWTHFHSKPIFITINEFQPLTLPLAKCMQFTSESQKAQIFAHEQIISITEVRPSQIAYIYLSTNLHCY